jgi:hypothetical protein
MVGIAHDGDFVLRPGPWKLPAVVAPAMRHEAAIACAGLKGRSGPAPKDVIDRFVAHLANLCAGKDLPPESKLEGIASAILRGGYPLALFDDPETLDRIARKFTWWPGWAEMAPVLDAERAALRVDYERLLQIAKGPKDDGQQGRDDEPTGPRVMSEATDKLLAEFWARNGGRPKTVNERAATSTTSTGGADHG